NHARTRTGRRGLHRSGHPVLGSDGRWTDDSTLLRARIEKSDYIAGDFSVAPRVSAKLGTTGHSFRVLQSVLSLWSGKICPPGGAVGRGWRAMRRSAAGREWRAEVLDGRSGIGFDFSAIADQRAGPCPVSGATGARLHLLRFGH